MVLQRTEVAAESMAEMGCCPQCGEDVLWGPTGMSCGECGLELGYSAYLPDDEELVIV